MFARKSVLVAGMMLILAVLLGSAVHAQSVKGSGSYPSPQLPGSENQLWVDARIDRHGIVTGHMVYSYWSTVWVLLYITEDLPVDPLVVDGNQALVGSGSRSFLIVDNGGRRKDT